MSKPLVLLAREIDDSTAPFLAERFRDFRFVDGREEPVLAQHLPEAEIIYGFVKIDRLAGAEKLRWLQLTSAGVPRRLCPLAKKRGFIVTNLAGLYGNTIAEHTIAVMTMLARNLHIAMRNQIERKWDASIAKTMTDLAGKTVAVMGLGDIGRAIARLAKRHGMRVIGCRRSDRPTPFVDRLYPMADWRAMLPEAEFVVMAAPLTVETTGWFDRQAFERMKRGAWFVNVSRGKIVDEAALLDALESGHLAGAALDVFHQEPLPPNHPLWEMPNVIVTPHYCGDTVNHSRLPLERFIRNLSAWQSGGDLEGLVELERGY